MHTLVVGYSIITVLAWAPLILHRLSQYWRTCTLPRALRRILSFDKRGAGPNLFESDENEFAEIARGTKKGRSQFLSSLLATPDRHQNLPGWLRRSVQSTTVVDIENAGDMELTMLSTIQLQKSISDSPAATSTIPTNPTSAEAYSQASFISSANNASDFQAGDRVRATGVYIGQVSRFLGHGQFGDVFAVDVRSRDHHQLAMKCARVLGEQGSALDIDRLTLFCEEAYTSLHLGAHTNIVSLRYVCRNDAFQDRLLLFYDLVEGCDLITYLRQHRSHYIGLTLPLPTVQAHLSSLAYQLIEGLSWLHHRRVLHCDIKPENLLIHPIGPRLQITDFGLATICTEVDPMTEQPMCLWPGGTPAYRSPEIAASSSQLIIILPRTSDLWAAALTILQIFCGGNCLWHQRFPVMSPGEDGLIGLDTYANSPCKDGLFAEGSDLTHIDDEDLCHKLSGFNLLRELFVADLEALKTDYKLSRGDLARLRRLDREWMLISMPVQLEQLLFEALSHDPLNRPPSAQAWKQRLGQNSRAELDNNPIPAADTATSLVNIGLAFHHIERFVEAKRCYMDALRIAPGVVTAASIYNLATCCYKLGDTLAAHEYFQRTIDLDPTYARAYYALAKAARSRHDLPAMADLLRSCIQHDTSQQVWKARWKLGRVLRLLEGQPSMAIACYEECVRTSARCSEAHTYLAVELFVQGEIRTAQIHLEAVLQLDPNSVVGFYLLGVIKQAVDHFQQSVEISHGHCHRAMGDLFWAYGQDHYAMDAYIKASDLFPTDERLKSRIHASGSAISLLPSWQEVVERISQYENYNLLY